MNAIECAFTGPIGQEPTLKESKAGRPWFSLTVAVGEGGPREQVILDRYREKRNRVPELKVSNDDGIVKIDANWGRALNARNP
jgi:hypothetical protein